MRLAGPTLELAEYRAESTTNTRFHSYDLSAWDRFYLPASMTGLLDESPVDVRRFIEDDNRGAISPEPVATFDGTGFHLSVKGIGSTIAPFAPTPLAVGDVAVLTDDPDVRRRLGRPSVVPSPDDAPRWITGESWLRGSPYGGQGLEHAETALRVSERADLTSIAGFRIAPVVKISRLPSVLQSRIRSLHWFRRFAGPIVQEIRLVPSNVRIYFHARSTIGSNVRELFERFELGTDAKALRFEEAFLRSTIPLLTLFARTMRYDAANARYFGLDFHDVWLDKDAVVAPDGTVYFVDLEGIDEEGVERAGVREKIEDQVHRSLYELLFAHEQLDAERVRRFGRAAGRKEQLVALLERGLADDRFVRLRSTPAHYLLEIRNALGDDSLNIEFPLVDRR